MKFDERDAMKDKPWNTALMGRICDRIGTPAMIHKRRRYDCYCFCYCHCDMLCTECYANAYRFRPGLTCSNRRSAEGPSTCSIACRRCRTGGLQNIAMSYLVDRVGP